MLRTKSRTDLAALVSIAAIAGAVGLVACGSGDIADTSGPRPAKPTPRVPPAVAPPPKPDDCFQPARQDFPLAKTPHAVRLTSLQWERTMKDLLVLDAPPGSSASSSPGSYVDADKEYLVKFLNTIGAVVGCTNTANDGPLDDFNFDNNNYRSNNYTYDYYLSPQPAEPADGKPPIKGRLPALVVA